MTIIHNTNIERLMRFNPNKSFYYFIAIKRKKDHPELQIKDSQVIKTWIVKDIRDFYGYYIPEMLEIVKLHQCRLYMCTDRKSYTKSMLSIRNDINKQLDCAIGTDKTEYSPKILNNLLQSNIMKDESLSGVELNVENIQNFFNKEPSCCPLGINCSKGIVCVNPDKSIYSCGYDADNRKETKNDYYSRFIKEECLICSKFLFCNSCRVYIREAKDNDDIENYCKGMKEVIKKFKNLISNKELYNQNE